MPRTGRFSQEDPIRDGLNWYTYANNNPVLFIDPWGLAAYIFYDDNARSGMLKSWFWNHQIATLEKAFRGIYKGDVFLRSLTTAEAFINEWNDMSDENPLIMF